MEELVVRIEGGTVRDIKIYRESADAGEKFLDGIQAKLTYAQKEAVRRICHDNGLDMSAFARDAISAYIDLFPYKEKFERHRRVLRAVLDGLS
jgi:hypothetical protein